MGGGLVPFKFDKNFFHSQVLSPTKLNSITMINKDPNHKHTYDAQGNMTCCSLEEKIDSKTGEPHSHDDGHNHENGAENSTWKEYLPAIISFALLITGLIFDYFIKPAFFQNYIRINLLIFFDLKSDIFT